MEPTKMLASKLARTAEGGCPHMCDLVLPLGARSAKALSDALLQLSPHHHY